MTERNFSFPLSVLIHQGNVFHRALIDDAYAAPMAERLDQEKETANFATRFRAKLDQLGSGSLDHAGKRGAVGSLTQEQAAALKEVTRLTAMARHGAKITFKGESVRLRNEFQVGINTPKTLAAILERSRIILGSCKRYAAELKSNGWIARDTELLETTIATFDDIGLAQGAARSERSGISGAKTRFANEVYTDTLKIQNAASLQYPSSEPGNETARARFLLDEYPPRLRSARAVIPPAPAPIAPLSSMGSAPVFLLPPNTIPLAAEPVAPIESHELSRRDGALDSKKDGNNDSGGPPIRLPKP
ncbi:MAG: hypothetical protein JWL59_3324 [Chthoniobacteraceae bacterium]|nr:hypothetical protein [Chthoniobacteraceae bacterium]